jgi:hypothetical protein
MRLKIPSVTNIIFRGSPTDIMDSVKEGLVSNNFEWQFISKELKFKCRTRINGSDMWDDLSDGFNLEDFMKRDFVKFTVSIQKWSKDISEVYVVGFTFVKSAINCYLLDRIGGLV